MMVSEGAIKLFPRAKITVNDRPIIFIEAIRLLSLKKKKKDEQFALEELIFAKKRDWIEIAYFLENSQKKDILYIYVYSR